MFKIIKEYNELIDMWYHYRKLCRRLSSIRYYRRHGKFKPERVSIFKVYKNAFKGWFELFNRTFFVKETIDDRNKEWRRQTNDLYRRYKEKQEAKKHNQYEYPVGKNITHVRWIDELCGTYFTKNKIYKVNKVYESPNMLSIYFETNKNDKNDHCKIVFEKQKRKYAHQIELIYDNNI